MQWEDGMGGKGGGGDDGDAVSFITGVGACESDGRRVSSVGMLSQLQIVRPMMSIEDLMISSTRQSHDLQATNLMESHEPSSFPIECHGIYSASPMNPAT